MTLGKMFTPTNKEWECAFGIFRVDLIFQLTLLHYSCRITWRVS